VRAENKRNAKKFRGRRMRRFGFGGGIGPGRGGNGALLGVGRGAAFVGEIGDVWTLGVIGGDLDN